MHEDSHLDEMYESRYELVDFEPQYCTDCGMTGHNFYSCPMVKGELNGPCDSCCEEGPLWRVGKDTYHCDNCLDD
jgi:hypothetical protein